MKQVQGSTCDEVSLYGIAFERSQVVCETVAMGKRFEKCFAVQ